MTYGKERKEEILGRFHASGMSMRMACRSLPGFPCPHTLSAFVAEEEAGLLDPPALEVPGRCGARSRWGSYPVETRVEAVRLLAGGTPPRVIARRLGVTRPESIAQWARTLGERGEVDARELPAPLREEAVARFARGERPDDIAGALHVHARTVYRWAEKAGVKAGRERSTDRGGGARMVGTGGFGGDREEMPEGGKGGGGGEWRRAWGTLPDDPGERARVAEVRLVEALAVLDVLKAPGPNSLSSMEKYRAGQMARETDRKVRLSDALRDFRIGKSTYLSQSARMARGDKYAALRVRVRALFEAGLGRYGSEPVWAKLRKGPGVPVGAAGLAPGDMETPVIVSEKVVRSIMREEGLVPVQSRRPRRRYSSYAGEVDERPGNVPLREDGTHGFHADAPGKLVVTDVTEFSAGGFKVYLSPVIDCYDGCPLSWRISLRPDDDLTAGSLEDALPMLGGSCVVHTDGGGNYRSERWKEDCRRNGLVRSMSRKGASPDNARAEGFFGTLKQEFFYAADWTKASRRTFVRLLDEYIVWYRDSKVKKSLGWKTLKEHRASIGDAA